MGSLNIALNRAAMGNVTHKLPQLLSVIAQMLADKRTNEVIAMVAVLVITQCQLLTGFGINIFQLEVNANW